MNTYFVKELIQDILWAAFLFVVMLGLVVPLVYYTVKWLGYWFPN